MSVTYSAENIIRISESIEGNYMYVHVSVSRYFSYSFNYCYYPGVNIINYSQSNLFSSLCNVLLFLFIFLIYLSILVYNVNIFNGNSGSENVHYSQSNLSSSSLFIYLFIYVFNGSPRE